MIKYNPLLCTDFYKNLESHYRQYQKGTNLVYTNLTARGSRLPDVKKVVAFGLQAGIQILTERYQENFFDEPIDTILEQYKKRVRLSLGVENPIIEPIVDLHDLGYLPLSFYTLPEGELIPLRIPLLCVFNTIDEFFWLTNNIETDISANTWSPITSATLAHQYRKKFDLYGKETGAKTYEQLAGILGHDFSYRGMMGTEAAAASGAGHLLSFMGTDTAPALDWIEYYYDADPDKSHGGSVPATEHSVACLETAFHLSECPEEIDENYKYYEYITR